MRWKNGADHKELEAVFGMSRAALGLGHVLQGSVKDVQVDNVLQLLKVEKRGLGTNKYVRVFNLINISPRQMGQGSPREG